MFVRTVNRHVPVWCGFACLGWKKLTLTTSSGILKKFPVGLQRTWDLQLCHCFMGRCGHCTGALSVNQNWQHVETAADWISYRLPGPEAALPRYAAGHGRSVHAAASLAVSRYLATAGLFRRIFGKPELAAGGNCSGLDKLQIAWPEAALPRYAAGHCRSVLAAACFAVSWYFATARWWLLGTPARRDIPRRPSNLTFVTVPKLTRNTSRRPPSALRLLRCSSTARWLTVRTS